MIRRLLFAVAGVVLIATALATSALAQETTTAEAEKRTVVVLVDLSGSLSPGDFAEEVRAVGVMNTVPGIDLYVIGFASEGALPAIQVVCEPGDDLAECTKALARRSTAEGNDTDHAAALAGAVDVLESADTAEGSPRFVLFMTDGQYDPSGGGSPTQAEIAQLTAAIEDARAANISVWPLGFGRANKSELNALSVTSTDACKEARALIVTPAAEIPSAVNRIVGNVTCTDAFQGDTFTVPDDLELLVVTYGEDELRDGSVRVESQSGGRETVTCLFDDIAEVWTCEIPTADLGTGRMTLTPAPRLFPTPYQVVDREADREAKDRETRERPTTTTTQPEPTTTVTVAEPTTTIQTEQSTVEAAAPTDGSSGVSWVLVAAAIVAVGALAGAFVWSRRRQ